SISAAEFLGAGTPLPLAAALMLLALVPVASATASALALRSRPDPARDTFGSEELPEPAPVPSGLPWGVALMAAGLAVEAYASRGGSGSAFPLPGRFDATPVAVLAVLWVGFEFTNIVWPRTVSDSWYINWAFFVAMGVILALGSVIVKARKVGQPKTGEPAAAAPELTKEPV
nr:hypothetical protein [Streptomyces sp. DSM 41633]